MPSGSEPSSDFQLKTCSRPPESSFSVGLHVKRCSAQCAGNKAGRHDTFWKDFRKTIKTSKRALSGEESGNSRSRCSYVRWGSYKPNSSHWEHGLPDRPHPPWGTAGRCGGPPPRPIADLETHGKVKSLWERTVWVALKNSTDPGPVPPGKGRLPTSDTPTFSRGREEWNISASLSLSLSVSLTPSHTHNLLKCKEQGENVYLHHLAGSLNSSFQERNMFSLP